MNAFVDILRASRDNVHANFHCRNCTTLICCHKIASVPEVSLANQPIFLYNKDVRARTMGCKRGFSYRFHSGLMDARYM